MTAGKDYGIIKVQEKATGYEKTELFLYYCCYVYDRGTGGLMYLQSRYYDPAIGRFLNADTTDILALTPFSKPLQELIDGGVIKLCPIFE